MSGELEAQVESLRRMSRQQLKDRWRDLFKAAPPVAFTPDLLARGIAWRLQEKDVGGLSAEARRLLGASGGGEGLVLRPSDEQRAQFFVPAIAWSAAGAAAPMSSRSGKTGCTTKAPASRR